MNFFHVPFYFFFWDDGVLTTNIILKLSLISFQKAMMVQFFYCEKGEPTVFFCLICALLPTDDIYRLLKKQDYFLYSNLNLKKANQKNKMWGKEYGNRHRRGERHESLLALSARSYQKLFKRRCLNFLLCCEWLLFYKFA